MKGHANALVVALVFIPFRQRKCKATPSDAEASELTKPTSGPALNTGAQAGSQVKLSFWMASGCSSFECQLLFVFVNWYVSVLVACYPMLYILFRFSPFFSELDTLILYLNVLHSDARR